MFGKRSTTAATPPPRPDPVPAPAQPRTAEPQSRPAEPRPEPPQADKRQGGQIPAKAERKPVERARSEEYYDVKTTVFNALIDTIDLTQLSKLDPEAAREEIRDIVSEIVAIKNVVMSIAEQEELLEGI
jgi:pilus assembly protein CpaF